MKGREGEFLITRGAESRVVEWQADHRFEPEEWEVTTIVRGVARRWVAADCFDASLLMRSVWEADGWAAHIEGARANAWPSGMARDQGGGLSVYLLGTDGPEIVPTFSPTDEAVATVAEQEATTRRFMSGR